MKQERILTLDFETDPFEFGSEVKPFLWDIYDGESHTTYWGDDCIPKLLAFLASAKRATIFAHNGGKFDFMFLLDGIRGGNMLVIGSRIVECKLLHHTLRDSYAMLPVPQSKMDKGSIDYRKLSRGVRDLHKEEIITYLHRDTGSLYKYVLAYREEFGTKPRTMASAAIHELKEFHSYETFCASQDHQFRPYFHGGRVECFETGIIKTPGIKVYDVNSMYPSVMRNALHPLSSQATQGWRITSKTNFVTFRGISRGALPLQDGDVKRFPNDRKVRIWHTTIHEYRAGIETGTIQPFDLLWTWDFERQGTFDTFIDHFYESRMTARKNGDAVRELFYKLVMNSAYGKFAQNPDKYYDYQITGESDAPSEQCWHHDPDVCGCGGWRMATPPDHHNVLWKRRSRSRLYRGFHNVATAASITGAARAILLRAIVSCKRPMYCDTDSIICKDIGSKVEVDPDRLGAWKLEKTGDRLAVAGKKMYALFDGEKCVKQATKGVRLTPEQIVSVASGAEVEFKNDAPTLGFDGRQRYITRKVKRT